jgi:hypothetical protein
MVTFSVTSTPLDGGVRARGAAFDAGLRDDDDGDDGLRHFGKVTFVDLAGSERLDATESAGVTRVESGQINKSLFALGKVRRCSGCEVDMATHPSAGTVCARTGPPHFVGFGVLRVCTRLLQR